jgi:hypothetical protein
MGLVGQTTQRANKSVMKQYKFLVAAESERRKDKNAGVLLAEMPEKEV